MQATEAKMASLCWMAVVLTVFLSAGNSLAAVDQSWLASIIEGIKNQYALGDTFSLAVNIPENADPNDLQQVLQEDPADGVKQAVSSGQVYQGTRVVAAAQSGQLSLLLEKIEPFIKSSDGNVLIIYSTESPTNGDDVTGKIDSITQNWKSYAFVFSNVANAPDANPSQLAESFKQLGISKFGLDNIFRCYKPGDDPFQCTSCSSGGDVAPSCVANSAAPSNQEQGQGEGGIAPSTGTDTGVEAGPGGDLATNVGQEIVGGTGGQTGEGQGGQMRKRQRGRGKNRKVRKRRKQRRRGKGRGRGKRRGRRGKGKRGGRRRGKGKRRGGRRGKGRKGGKRGGRRKKYRGLE